ncbi:cation transporter [Caldalkalibacillus thermarum TA2.A1]|uniref:Cation transporter n=1 Tax=Caldalkalibacillus thermarum (strain TA2.A1) TaxID=986075 RepID=F5L6R8_CALTT|nr:TrkH family potassium uptake protein [Caldalkalibacillus thermarum]EGL82961.1 cation transporter [Caldalkalibacillus thermarum TA2.A1]QZT33597.1 TrkH family potassium uptake protein [Caldalkalibacillus thermarum TA2.A1]
MKLNQFLSPFRVIILAYAVLILIGTVLLYLPVSHKPGVTLTLMEALFTATSAITVTGLTVVNTADSFSLFGIAVLAVIIQLGGIGIMSLGTFIWLVTGRKINLSQRMLIMVDQNQLKFSGLVHLIKNMLAIAIVIEGIGAVILGTYYLNYFDPWHEAFLQGAFASLTAFTNSGFDITGQSLIPFAHDYFVQVVTMLLIVAGAIGFPVLVELKEYLSGKHSQYRFSLFTKVAVTTYLVLLVFGAVSIWLLERGHYYAGMAWHQQLFFSLFNSVTARSAGLATMDIAQYSAATLLLISGLMIIGASPSSVGGGIRTTTLAVMFLTIRAFAQGKQHVHVFGRELHDEDIRKAFIVLSVFIGGLFLAIVLIAAIEQGSDIDLVAIIFEVSSAFGTCGLSMGITADLSPFSQLILMVLMFIGRIGLVVLLFSMKKTETKQRYHYPKERIIIG